jgi:hypothetical protein
MMPFNSHSYHRNKEKRRAQEYLAEARLWKQELVAGTLDFPSTPERVNDRIASRVKLARAHWKGYLAYKSMCECDADYKRRLRGEMSHADFMAKWDTRKGQK